MKNKINFITGETYTIAELFSGIRKIIIPDLQRDYCWGNETHTSEKKELVSGFVNTLIEQYKEYKDNDKSDSLNLGLIYGYEAPENHIQLCDGQQRITTLFLLLGMLNKYTSHNAFRKYLISDFEYFQDDQEPYLQYSIRESSLYFLSDLVCHFFIKENDDRYHVDTIEQIESSSWFFHEYRLDPSIQSMIKALHKIQSLLMDKDEKWCLDFGLFVATKLTFMYYDMGNRRNGEETFVVINTTGEPLSKTQNLKPLIFLEPINKNYERTDASNATHTLSEDWEEVENWFWKKRVVEENDTADAGFNEFLRWIAMLNTDKNSTLREILSKGIYTFPKESVPFKTIWKYWEVVKFLFESWEYRDKLSNKYLSPGKNKELKGNKVLSQIDCFHILPLMVYCETWKVKSDNRNLRRLYEFIHNLSRIDTVQKNVNTLVEDVIQIAKECCDIVDMVNNNLWNTISPMILTEEEKLKIEILKNNPTNRNDIEELFWNAQSFETAPCHKIWSGQILPLIKWSTDEQGFNIELFRNYSDLFDKTFTGDNLDIVRRALLTRNLNEYPKIFSGYTNYSFAWVWSDWQTLIKENRTVFQDFFDDIERGTDCQSMIDSYSGNTKWAEFVQQEYLLEYCHKKNIQWDDKEGWLCIREQRATKYMSVKNLHLKHYLSKVLIIADWSIEVYDETDNHVIVVENKIKNFVFDIWYIESQPSWVLNFFSRDAEVECSLKSYIDNTWIFNGERYEKSLVFSESIDSSGNYTYQNVLDELNNIINKLP